MYSDIKVCEIPKSFAHSLNLCFCTFFWGKIHSFPYVLKEACDTRASGCEALVCVMVRADQQRNSSSKSDVKTHQAGTKYLQSTMCKWIISCTHFCEDVCILGCLLQHCDAKRLETTQTSPVRHWSKKYGKYSGALYN